MDPGKESTMEFAVDSTSRARIFQTHNRLGERTARQVRARGISLRSNLRLRSVLV
jgi:hypothetical protein